jgi:hypothetical protein
MVAARMTTVSTSQVGTVMLAAHMIGLMHSWVVPPTMTRMMSSHIASFRLRHLGL